MLNAKTAWDGISPHPGNLDLGHSVQRMEQKLGQLARLDFEYYNMPVRRARGPAKPRPAIYSIWRPWGLQ